MNIKYHDYSRFFLIMLAIISVLVCEDVFSNNNFYIGAGMGVHNTTFDTTGYLIRDNYYPVTNAGSAQTFSFIENTFIGIGEKTKRFYYAVEINYALLTGEGKATNIKGNAGNPSGQDASYSVKQTLNMLFGASLILGSRVRMGHNNIIYLRGGWVNGRFHSVSEQSDGFTSGYSGKFTKWDSGFIVGIGFNSFFKKKFALRAEYDYLGFAKFSKISSANAWASGTAKWQYHPYANVFIISVLYFI